MSTNFQFLKKINNGLFGIISEAEELYRDEYFEQCMVQTRRFGEQICKEIMLQNNQPTGSFDDMIASLKDKSHGYPQEKEFIEDLYFLKKNGNQSVHSGKVSKDAMVALECLKRSFEIAISYAVYNQGASSDILKYNYDVELLVTNKRRESSLKQKYEKAKKREYTNNKYIDKPIKKTEKKEPSVINKNVKNVKFYKLSLFWKFILFSTSVSLLIIAFLSVCLLFQH